MTEADLSRGAGRRAVTRLFICSLAAGETVGAQALLFPPGRCSWLAGGDGFKKPCAGQKGFLVSQRHVNRFPDGVGGPRSRLCGPFVPTSSPVLQLVEPNGPGG